MSEKKCNNCGNRAKGVRHSDEWCISAELAKRCRRLFIILLAVAFLWVCSVPVIAGIASGEFAYIVHDLHTQDSNDERKYMQKFFNDEWELFIKHCGFTDSEMEVVALLRRGWHEEDIAAETYTSRSTVKRRKKSIAIKISHYLVNHT